MTRSPNDVLRKIVEAVEIATGRRIHKSTGTRWVNTGRLKAWKLAGRQYTTVTAVLEMLEQSSASMTSKEPQPHRRKEICRAEQAINDL